MFDVAPPPLIGFDKPAIVRPGELVAPAMFMPIIPPARQLTAISFVPISKSGTGSGSASSIPVPSGVLENDLLLCCAYQTQTSGILSDVLPAGFTALASAYRDASGGNSRHKVTLSYRLAGNSEGSSYALNYSSTYAAIQSVRPSRPISTVTVKALQTATTTDVSGGGTATAYSQVAAAGDAPYIFLSAIKSRYPVAYGPGLSQYATYPPDGVWMRDAANIGPALSFRAHSFVPTGVQNGNTYAVLQGYIGTSQQTLTASYYAERTTCPIACYLTFT